MGSWAIVHRLRPGGWLPGEPGSNSRSISRSRSPGWSGARARAPRATTTVVSRARMHHTIHDTTSRIFHSGHTHPRRHRDHRPGRLWSVPNGAALAEHRLVVSQGATTTEIPLSSSQLLEVKQVLSDIMSIFAEKAAYHAGGGMAGGDTTGSAKPKKWDNVDVCVKEGEHGVRVELFCNPNACVNAFEATVLVTVRDCRSGLRVVTECGLEALKSAYRVCVEEMS